ncbi:MAG: alpha/beta hydrolase [Dermatophilaceae bacterium]
MTEHPTSTGIAYTRSGRGPGPEQSGDGHDPRGVVLVHGWCCDRSYLAPQGEHLAPTRSVVALDLRGHGSSTTLSTTPASTTPASTTPAGADDAYAITDFADDVASVLTDAGLDQPIVIGHSLGGLVALECAARGQASAVVLLDPAPILDERGRSYFARSVPDVEADVDGAWRRRFVDRIVLPTDTVRLDEIRSDFAAVDPHVAATTMRGMATYDSAAALRAISVPVLIISAAHPEDPAPLRDLLPHLVTGQTVGAGHFLQLEVPEQVNAMIDRFLALWG